MLIATPAAGGMLTTQYFTSMLATQEKAREHKQAVAQKFLRDNPPGPNVPAEVHAQMLQPIFDQHMREHTIDLGIHTMAGESLLPRGRNHLAQQALTGQWDKLFFIDADAGWTPEDFWRVVSSNKMIVAGTCPLKIFPISLNFLPFKDDEHYFREAIRSPESLANLRAGHGADEIKIPFIGTAFMCINTEVLKRLAEVTPQYQYPNPMTANLETHWDFFNCSPVNETYMSEDWGFCDLARRNGFDVYMNSAVCINHTGNWTFKTGQRMEIYDVAGANAQPPKQAEGISKVSDSGGDHNPGTDTDRPS